MPSNTLPRGYQLDEYEIETVLGTGGFGITYQAHDSQLGTWVAIKEYFPQDLAGRDEAMTTIPHPGPATQHFEWGRQQFLKEARSLARFKHSNIVRVLRFLELNGTAYMIMEYEKGQGLLDYMRKNGQPDERMLLRIFVPILNGLQAVHRAGLLHLDIKPENIYLRDEGAPMLIDFGSARNVALAGEAGERVALTPAYAAPEQFTDTGRQGPWTDLYAIGASLYHCVSGSAPVDARTRQEAIRQGKADPLTSATRRGTTGYSGYLLECIDWAVELQAEQRPQRAVDLQEALMGKGRPDRKPVARVAAPLRDTARRPDRGRSATAPRASFNSWRIAQLVMAALVLIGGVLVVNGYRDFSASPRPAPPVTPDAAETSTAAAEPEAPDAPAPAAAVIAGTVPERSWRDHQPVRLVRTLAGHQDAVASLAPLANGAQLASASVDGTIRIWDVVRGGLLRTLHGHQRSVHVVAASPDGALLASAGNESDVLLWDTTTYRQLGSLSGHGSDVYALAFSSDGKWLASGGRDRTIVLWDMHRRQSVRTLEGHDGPVLALAFSPDGEWLLSGGKGGQIKRWSVAGGVEIDGLTSHRGQAVTAVAISPDGDWFASSSDADQVRLWSVDTGKPRRVLADSSGFGGALIVSPDGQQLLAAGSGRAVQSWDVRSAGAGRVLARQEDEIQATALLPDRRTIATAGMGRSVRIWSAETR